MIGALHLLSCRFAKASSDAGGGQVIAAPEKPVTRTVEEWVPDRILCRRFNVPDPFAGRSVPASTASGTGNPSLGVATGRPSKFSDPGVDMFTMPAFAGLRPAASPITTPGAAVSGGGSKVDGTGAAAAAATATEVEPPATRPPVDLFKSIFEPSDSEED